MIYIFGEFRFDSDTLELSRSGQRIAAKPRSLELLNLLIVNHDRVVPKSEVFDVIWDGRDVSDSTLATVVKDLRGHLGDTGKRSDIIRSLYGRGLRFVGEVSSECGAVPGITTDADCASDLSSPVRNTACEVASPRSEDSGSTIAVLPFEVQPDTDDARFLANGIADDLIDALSRFHAFGVISRLSSFAAQAGDKDAFKVGQELRARYLLQGSVQSQTSKIRVTIRLTNAETGTEIWTSRYDPKDADVFSLQDEITRSVVAAVVPAVSQNERARLTSKADRPATAWECYHKGGGVLLSFNSRSQHEACAYFDRALEKDPSITQAFAAKAYSLNIKFSGEVYDAQEGDRLPIDKAELYDAYDYVQTALKTRTHDAFSWFVLSRCALALGNIDEALEASATAIRLNPYSPNAQIGRGLALLHAGRADESLASANTVLTFQKSGPFIWIANAISAQAHALLGNSDEAILASKAAQDDQPTSPFACMGEIWAHGQRRQPERAAAPLKKLSEIGCYVTVERFDLAQPFSVPSVRAAIHSWMLAAGIPAN